MQFSGQRQAHKSACSNEWSERDAVPVAKTPQSRRGARSSLTSLRSPLTSFLLGSTRTSHYHAVRSGVLEKLITFETCYRVRGGLLCNEIWSGLLQCVAAGDGRRSSCAVLSLMICRVRSVSYPACRCSLKSGACARVDKVLGKRGLRC